MTTPTQQWLSTTEFMPPLDGPPGIAERLVLLLHYAIDWENSWVARYRTTYWDKILPDRVLVAAHQATTLRSWWTALADDLSACPTTPEERRELASLLETEHSTAVIRCLTEETSALVLRVRIVSESRKKARN